ncbi:hypothetical protein ALI144C_42800 [Actinosynnema sp. ALI-1.44]|uniref:hypothetical protein n=1 Tax=Actinosynnema sp. ALI-1.44 TaxID=1933779 RepID=UPI00097BFAA9|nr:hypothetical protein [Actinosynnema sp. ALI-1.44]ONI72740.1 hypothetical protein ALI144C_42800 [Actinosynnema sp. ALI-1.44]
MSWQEDLRQLDQALAEGRIHADDYRKRRDQLLATATGATTPPAPTGPASNPFPAQQPQATNSGPFPAQQPQASNSGPFPAQQPPASNPFPAQQPPQQPTPPPPPQQPTPQQQAEATQVHQPGQQPTSGPFPTAFRWEPTQGGAESTQIVGQQPGGNPDVTQVVSQEPGGNTAEAERTQVVRPVQQPGMQHQAPWHSTPPNPNQGSPWGVDDQPMPSMQPTWLAQGPEVFAEDKGSKFGKGAKILVALVLVIGLGVGAYFVFFTGKDENQPGAIEPPPSPTPTSTTKPKPPRDELSIADMPGKLNEKYNSVKTFADAKAENFLTPTEVQILTDAGAGKARLAVSDTPEAINPSVFTTQTTSAETAAVARDKLAEQQIVNGAKALENQPTGVIASKYDKTANTPAFIRAHYAHKGTLVRIQVVGSDLVTVTEVFNDLLADQLKILAANG